MKKILERIEKKELIRQQNNVELIASENIVSTRVLKALSSIFTNKYAEGYPKKRYYGGCENADELEDYAINTLKKLFNADHANVQPHSGSQANEIVLNAFLKPNDKILSMSLDSGGHLSHGYKFNMSGKLYNVKFYHVDPKTERIDYDNIRKIALEFKPNLIICGASSYSRIIDFEKFSKIAKEINAYLLADIAHICGLVVSGLHPNPVPYCDAVTSTTHKTLRGPRGGIILCKEEHKKKIDSSLFPGIQGGPLLNIIYSKAVCFEEASSNKFKNYQKQILANCRAMVNEFLKKDIKIISNGSDNHLFVINVKKSYNITGKVAQDVLEKINITLNKNVIPFDDENPFVTSGIRIGTPAITSRGFKERECIRIANVIDLALRNINNNALLLKLKKEIQQILNKFPIYLDL